MNTAARHALLATCIVTLAVAGCTRNHPRPLDLHTDQLTSHDAESSSYSSGVGTGELNPLNATAGVKTVYFDYDSYALRPDTLTTLKRNASIFSRDVHRDIIQIEGHCDERGTQEYNLALGEQRALAVRQHLINLGIDSARIMTISYGEERPADAGHSENANALNRRCEFAANAH